VRYLFESARARAADETAGVREEAYGRTNLGPQ